MWYKSFLKGLENQGIDIHDPLSFRLINTYKRTVIEGDNCCIPFMPFVQDEHGFKGMDSSFVPDSDWLEDNLPAPADLNDEQVESLFQMSENMQLFVLDPKGNARKGRTMVYTDGKNPEALFSEFVQGSSDTLDRYEFKHVSEKRAKELAARHTQVSAEIGMFRLANPNNEEYPTAYALRDIDAVMSDCIVNEKLYSVLDSEGKKRRWDAICSKAAGDWVSGSPETYYFEHTAEITAFIEKTGYTVSEAIKLGLITDANGNVYAPDKPVDVVLSEIEHAIFFGNGIGVKELDGENVHLHKLYAEKVEETDYGTGRTVLRNIDNKVRIDTPFVNEKKPSDNLKPTTYGGQFITEDQKKQLESQPAAELLSFKKIKGGYNISQKLPETGRSEAEKNYKIREPINIVTKYVAKYVLDDMGNLDFSRVRGINDIMDNFGMGFNSDEWSHFINAIGIPEEKFGVIDDLMQNNPDLMRIVIGELDNHLYALEGFQKSLEIYKSGAMPGYEAKYVLADSYDDYMNHIGNLKELASMDPEKETRILSFMDCLKSAQLMNTAMEDANNRRAHENKELISGGFRKIDFQNEMHQKDDPKNHKYLKFFEHAVFMLNARLDGKDIVISAESTAAPDGKLLFCDPKGNKAIGFFNDQKSLIDYHTDNNIISTGRKEKEAFNKCKNSCSEFEELGLDNPVKASVPSDIVIAGYERKKDTSLTYAKLKAALTAKKSPVKKSSSLMKAFDKVNKAKGEDARRSALADLSAEAKKIIQKDAKGLSNIGKLKPQTKMALDVYEYCTANINKINEAKRSRNPMGIADDFEIFAEKEIKEARLAAPVAKKKAAEADKEKEVKQPVKQAVRKNDKAPVKGM